MRQQKMDGELRKGVRAEIRHDALAGRQSFPANLRSAPQECLRMKLHSLLMAGVPAIAALCLIAPAQAASDTRPPPAQLPKPPISASTLMIKGLTHDTSPLRALEQ